MSSVRRKELKRISTAVTAVAEEVFNAVQVIRDDALHCHRDAAARGARLRGDDISVLGARIQRVLQEPGRLVTGLGLIVAPGMLADESLRLEWWQTDEDRAVPVALNVDLNPSSLGFYDYAAAEWFAVPRQSGGRHVVGPYVDVHGTGRYILTFTMPVIADGNFLGVAGADVPAAWFETRLLHELGPDVNVVVLNAEHRVVLSTSTEWITGALMPVEAVLGSAGEAVVCEDLPNLPWRIRAA